MINFNPCSLLISSSPARNTMSFLVSNQGPIKLMSQALMLISTMIKYSLEDAKITLMDTRLRMLVLLTSVKQDQRKDAQSNMIMFGIMPLKELPSSRRQTKDLHYTIKMVNLNVHAQGNDSSLTNLLYLFYFILFITFLSIIS